MRRDNAQRVAIVVNGQMSVTLKIWNAGSAAEISAVHLDGRGLTEGRRRKWCPGGARSPPRRYAGTYARLRVHERARRDLRDTFGGQGCLVAKKMRPKARASGTLVLAGAGTLPPESTR